MLIFHKHTITAPDEPGNKPVIRVQLAVKNKAVPTPSMSLKTMQTMINGHPDGKYIDNLQQIERGD